MWNAIPKGAFVSYQPPLPIAPRTPLSPSAIDELVADPSRLKGLMPEALPDLLAQVGSRIGALKILEGALLSMVLNQHVANRGAKGEKNELLTAPQLAKLWGVPESWVRDQARMGNLPHVRLGHYMRFKLDEAEQFLAGRARQAA